jgi:hypothetical protein
MNNHNLDITTYTFDEVLNIFNLSYEVNEDHIKTAKKKVLMMHPDKSRLPPEYFLFYKKAFDIVVNYYVNRNKMNIPITQDKLVYNKNNENYNKNIKSKISEMKKEEFNKVFNDLFEKNIVKKNSTKNDWFKDESADYSVTETVNQSNMSSVFDNIRQKASDNSIVRYNGYQNIVHNSNGLNNYYEEDEEENNSDYISSELFSKLKFDDIRKVHRDQTVLSVSEKDFNNVKTYSSIDEYNRARGGQDIKPISKQESSYVLKKQEEEYNKLMAQKQYKHMINMQKYNEINKAVMATFLQLENNK